MLNITYIFLFYSIVYLAMCERSDDQEAELIQR